MIHNIHRSLAFLPAIILLFFASSVLAYTTTEQEAVKLSDDTFLFSITYHFGHGTYNLELPVLAMQSNQRYDNALSYTIYDSNGNEVGAESIGIVFSNATLGGNGMYQLKKGESSTFTLSVLYTPAHVDLTESYRLQVEQLPFMLAGTNNKLNPPELKPYTTELVSW